MPVDVDALYFDGAICKHVCDCVVSFFESIQFLYDAFNFYEYLVSNGLIIKDNLLIFIIYCLNLLAFFS